MLFRIKTAKRSTDSMQQFAVAHALFFLVFILAALGTVVVLLTFVI